MRAHSIRMNESKEEHTMPSPIPQYRTWDDAKKLAREFRYDEAIALYRSVENDMKNISGWRPDNPERDNLFEQAMFFGDYCGALADSGHYAEAKEAGEFSLKCVEKGKFSTLKYIYYNMGNLFLFQKEYEQACKWYEIALDGVKIFYNEANNHLVNYGIAMYCSGKTDKAKEIFQLAISSSKDTIYNRSFEPFFYISKICGSQGDEKESQKYRKMYLTRLKKYSRTEIEWATSTMEDGKEIMADYEGEVSGSLL